MNVFDVVGLKNGYKATILESNKDTYKVEIINNKGLSQGIKQINEKDIEKIIFQNKCFCQ